METYQNYIDGQFVDAPETAPVINPSTGETIALQPVSGQAEVDAAVAAAKAAQPGWAALTNSERAAYLNKLAVAIRAKADDIAHILVLEQGKTQALAGVEANFAPDYVEYIASFARHLFGEVIPSDRPGEQITLTYQPKGVVAGILPWNFPYFLIVRKLAPALLTGNTIVLKPSSDTPINAFEFMKALDTVGLPKGVVNMVGGRGSVVGTGLAAHPDVDLVTMTGSVSVGKDIMAAAAANLTPVNLELGGKAPAIVLADADMDLAVQSIFDSRVINTGQVCNCAEVALVEESVYDEFVQRFTEKMKTTRYGNPDQTKDLDMGPLINAGAVESLDKKIAQAVSDGCTVETGGSRATDKGNGFFYQPTVLSGATRDMDIVRHEIFGPVLPVVKVKNLDEALDIANSSEYGLTSSVFTQSLDLAMKASRELLYGETYVNRENFEAMQGFHAGRRASGIGGADGLHGLLEFVDTHMTYLQTH